MRGGEARTFSGKKYKYFRYFGMKSHAKEQARILRSEGRLARIIKTKLGHGNLLTQGGAATTIYVVYAR